MTATSAAANSSSAYGDSEMKVPAQSASQSPYAIVRNFIDCADPKPVLPNCDISNGVIATSGRMEPEVVNEKFKNEFEHANHHSHNDSH